MGVVGGATVVGGARARKVTLDSSFHDKDSRMSCKDRARKVTLDSMIKILER